MSWAGMALIISILKQFVLEFAALDREKLLD